MAKPFKAKKSELNLDDLLAEISTIDVKKHKETDKTVPPGEVQKKIFEAKEEITEKERTPATGKSEAEHSKKDLNKINLDAQEDPEEFNAQFDKEMDDNFASPGIEMIGKTNMPATPEIPELPYFPTMSDIENFLEQKVPKLPNHFTIEVPPEFEEIVPPEPLGEPPPPPILPGGKH
jgi:hypothetical protein